MTEEQLNEACALAVRHGGAYSSIRATTISYEALASIIAEVRAEERERCAKALNLAATNLPVGATDRESLVYMASLSAAANAIRALGQQPAGGSDSEEKKNEGR